MFPWSELSENCSNIVHLLKIICKYVYKPCNLFESVAMEKKKESQERDALLPLILMDMLGWII